MIERLETIEKKYNEITEELMKPEIISDIKKTLELTKEQASLRECYDIYQVYKNVLSDIEAATEMLKDASMEEFAREAKVFIDCNVKEKAIKDALTAYLEYVIQRSY